MTARQIRRVTPVNIGPALAIGLPPIEENPPWQAYALCAEVDPDAFFPEQGEPTAAKRTCMACEVRTECLEYALANDERYGIWGGLSERQRRRIKRDRAAEVPMEVAS